MKKTLPLILWLGVRCGGRYLIADITRKMETWITSETNSFTFFTLTKQAVSVFITGRHANHIYKFDWFV